MKRYISEKKEVARFQFDEVKKTDGSEELLNYSGKTVMWKGELVRKIDNDAYFEYILQLETKDEIRVLSGRGIDHDIGDYVKVTGMILIKNGRFSHLVSLFRDLKLPTMGKPRPPGQPASARS